MHHHVMREEGPKPIVVQVTTDTANFNAFTAAGSPAGKVRVAVVIASGVYVYATGLGTPAFTWGTGWAAGSQLTLVNGGFIVGKGTSGTNGTANGATPSSPNTPGSGMILGNLAVTIDNTAGLIGGGGRGGIGGIGATVFTSQTGGGGGRDYTGTSGGTAAPNGTNGSGGNKTGPGGHGQGGSSGFGQVGGSGSSGTDWGGGSSFAISLNGQSITWLGGNNSSQVKGQVA